LRPYVALMQSLAAETVPEAKRRKLDHVQELDWPRSGQGDGLNPDEVEEAEEGPETAMDGLLEDDCKVEDASDPFEVHFADPDHNVLSRRLQALQKESWISRKIKLPKIGKAIMNLPGVEDENNGFELSSISRPAELKLKQKLASVVTKQRPFFDSLEKYMAPLIFNYQDVLFCERNTLNAESLRRLACLHALNHVFKLVSNQRLTSFY